MAERKTILLEDDETLEAIEDVRLAFERAKLIDTELGVPERRGETLAIMIDASGWAPGPNTPEARERRELAARILKDEQVRREFQRRAERRRTASDSPAPIMRLRQETHAAYERFREELFEIEAGTDRARRRPGP